MHVMQAKLDWFVRNGGVELAEAHMAECLPLTAEEGEVQAVDWGTYTSLEEAECLLLVVVLDDVHNILGYVVGSATPSIHNKGKFDFSTTAFYTVPEHRGTGVAKMLFEALVRKCKEVGISDINYSVSEAYPDAHKTMQSFGMTHTESMYSFRIKE